MLVPAAVEDLHDAHAALDQPAGQQRAGRERAGLLHLRAVHAPSVSAGSFDRSVSSGTLGLHAERHLVLGDARLRFRVAVLVEASSGSAVPSVSSMARRFASLTPGGFCTYSTGSPTLRRATPLYLPGRKPLAHMRVNSACAAAPDDQIRREHDERRQVVALAAEAVAEPRADARLAGHLAAGHHERAGRVVVDGVGVDRLDQGDVVDALRGVRQQFADPRAALAVLRELEHRRRDRQPRLAAGHGGDPLAHADAVGQVLVEVLDAACGL